jgi:tRNA 2-thiouridine synthesizing protein D
VASITVVIGDPPYGKERAYTALRFILAALYEKHLVNLFLLEDAVFLAKKGQEPKEMPALLEHAAMPNCEELLKAAVKQGAKVGICGVCCSERALKQEELTEGCQVSSMKNLVNWVVESDKVMFF